MKPAHAAYLESLQDDQQFPGARCNKSHDNMLDVYMYGKTASSGVESMNRANDEVRGKNAVDPLNAALIILKKEVVDSYEVSQTPTRCQGFQIAFSHPRVWLSWKRYLQSVTLLSTVCR